MIKQTNSTVDVIILSNNKDPESSSLTKNCVESYIKTTPQGVLRNIFVIETNEFDSTNYNSNIVTVVKPKQSFNYNKFINIGLEMCKSDYVVMSNNDIIVHENCINKMSLVFDNYKNVYSLSPVDRNWECHSQEHFPKNNCLYYGYRSSYEIFGPCICCKRKEVFDLIGYLDERFFFYWQDNDYAECLKANKLQHALFTGSQVTHNHDVKDGTRYNSKEEYRNLLLDQQKIFNTKWYTEEPFCSGGFKQFKPYKK